MEMINVQRLSLSNQYKIMAMLGADNAECYQRLQMTIERDFSVLPTMTCRIIIMKTYHGLREPITNLRNHLKDKADIDDRRLNFLGFYVVTKARYPSDVRFWINTEGRYTHLDSGTDGFNSPIGDAGKISTYVINLAGQSMVVLFWHNRD